MRWARITEKALDIGAICRDVSSDASGAVAVILGPVRAENEGRDVTGIEYSAYKEMAEKEMLRILDEAADRFDVDDMIIEHRIGELLVGEASIAVAVAHPHRHPALDAVRYIIDETKARAPIWKKEHYTDGTREWVNAGKPPQ